ncbi:MAG: hypothetical protein K0R50_205 [Eubacterium sp.]|nr:hypothetical protein [Eubacterium sp.]
MKYVELDADNEEELCNVAKALSSPTRIDILKLLYYHSYNVGEISEKLNIPASSAGVHIKILENAGLIHTELQPGTRGSMKICSRKSDLVTIRLTGTAQSQSETHAISMPVGAFTDCEVFPTCGLAYEEGYIAGEDKRETFYSPERIKAQLLWTSSGFVEYRFPNPMPKGKVVKSLSLSMEICSEAPNYREDWKSDITLWANGVDCGTWTCPGDFGERRGRLNPSWWQQGSTQYGLLTTWSVTASGTYVNGKQISGEGIDKLDIGSGYFISIRIGNKPDCEFLGGFNIFGKAFGDYSQDIILTVEY